MTEILAIRHAQASFDADDYDQLSPLGEDQALRLGRWLAADRDIGFDAVVVGAMRRHQQTLAGIEQAFAEQPIGILVVGTDGAHARGQLFREQGAIAGLVVRQEQAGMKRRIARDEDAPQDLVRRVLSALEQARDSVKSATNGFYGQLRIALSAGVG